MMNKYRTTRAAELETLGIFREFIAKVCQENGINEEISFELQLAMDEACTNVIQHGYAGMNPGSIILDLELTAEEICLQITDFGQPFEPSSAPKPDTDAPFEEREMGGFGLFFIYSVMDSVDYETSELGNILTLRKSMP
jgi:anti-sigma regulatory factor (Ser/Thr protein kinase)